jgi:1-acyl-sn-glycerol-3-phosphate acyltransferase
VRAFHLGAFKAAIAAQRPVVPVALDGIRRVLREGAWLPRPVRITVTICPPVLPQSDASDWHEIVRVRDAARETIARYASEPLL